MIFRISYQCFDCSYYQNIDRIVQTQRSWLHDFSGCMLMIFCDIKSGKRWLIVLATTMTLCVQGSI